MKRMSVGWRLLTGENLPRSVGEQCRPDGSAERRGSLPRTARVLANRAAAVECDDHADDLNGLRVDG